MHPSRLEALREREADLGDRLATQAHTPPDGAALAELANQVETIVASESPEQAKELLRLLIKDIQVHDRRRIIPTYRIPAAVRAIPRKMGGTGLEPVTPSLSIRPLAYRPVPPFSVCFRESRCSARFRRLSSRSTTSDGRRLTASSGTAQALHPFPDQRTPLEWQSLASEIALTCM